VVAWHNRPAEGESVPTKRVDSTTAVINASPFTPSHPREPRERGAPALARDRPRSDPTPSLHAGLRVRRVRARHDRAGLNPALVSLVVFRFRQRLVIEYHFSGSYPQGDAYRVYAPIVTALASRVTAV
jgi:hypothetical protein